MWECPAYLLFQAHSHFPLGSGNTIYCSQELFSLYVVFLHYLNCALESSVLTWARSINHYLCVFL